MPKLITLNHPDQVSQQAREYVRTYILMPSGMLGLVCLLGTVGGLGYQLMASDDYTWDTFYYSSGLLLLGIILGTGLTAYHRYLFREFPQAFAARMKLATGKQSTKAKKEMADDIIDHAGRSLIPVAYLVGIATLVGASGTAIVYGQVEPFPAFLTPWAGFYWAKLFLWRRVIL
ncbi:MAG: hypothetical protein OEY28_03000 [Nitrospira sp.]|nr:hypothetical protein [Nitrospira sp.]